MDLQTEHHNITQMDDFEHQIKKWFQPLKIETRNDVPPRINIISCGIRDHVFGGLLCIFHFAIEARKHGFNVRHIVSSEYVLPDGANVGPKIREIPDMVAYLKNHDGLSEIDTIEHVAIANDTVLECNQQDVFVATIWWTALVAHETAKALNPGSLGMFAYFIQDYEPLFMPSDTTGSLIRLSYTLPHFPMFSTKSLREFFQMHRYGIFQKDQSATTFTEHEPAIAKTPVLHRETLTKCMCFYARPHKPRNTFEIGLFALRLAVQSGTFSKDWTFYGLGAKSSGTFDLGNGCTLVMVKNVIEAEYLARVSKCDIGLSLMSSPHPSLPPLDFAAAGVVTVTNAFETKTDEMFSDISNNFVVAQNLDPFSVAEALKKAVVRVGDLETRRQNQNIRWAREWNETYTKDHFEKMLQRVSQPSMQHT